MIRAALTFSFFACALNGQQIFTNSSVNFNNGEIRATFSNLNANPGTVVAGAPYSADRVTEHIQTLADGTHIRQQNSTEHIARDSEGRTRIERSLLNGSASQGAPSITLIQIFDPVAGAGYILDDQNKVAHRVTLHPVELPEARPSAGGSGIVRSGVSVTLESGVVATGGVVQARPARPTSTQEKLGDQTIEGVVAEGTRSSTTWPIGAQGNDRPITDTGETWYSRELKTLVLSKRVSPQFGESVMKLTNISRAEPSAALFLPPPDYTVVDDGDTITLNLKRP
jgi:hypothetical protein